MSLWGKASKRIQHFQINKLDTLKLNSFKMHLDALTKKNTAAISIGLSIEGMPKLVQCEIAADALMQRGKELGVKVYVFGEDQVFGPALCLATIGDRLILDQSSIIGHVGFSKANWMMKRFLEDYRVKAGFQTKGKHKMRLNRFEEFTQEDIDWL